MNRMFYPAIVLFAFLMAWVAVKPHAADSTSFHPPDASSLEPLEPVTVPLQ